jgi:uncharacterized protein (TIGR03435 family)
MQRSMLVAAAVVFVGTALVAQTSASPSAAFDVTSVKLNNSGSGRIMMLPAANGGWQATNVTLGMLVRIAFQIQDNQIVGGPKWLFEDRFDVMGSGTAPGRDGVMFAKLQTLLADRFHVVTHREKRELPMYALVQSRRDGKLGEKISPSTVDCPTAPAAGGRGPAPGPGPGPGRGPQFVLPAPGERPRCGFGIGPGSIMAGGSTMAALAQQLSRIVGSIVEDKTNLTGQFDYTLTYAPDPGLGGRGDLPPLPGGGAPTAPSDAPSIFAALQEQLGLKLESTKGPVDVLVIDSADKPTAD